MRRECFVKQIIRDLIREYPEHPIGQIKNHLVRSYMTLDEYEVCIADMLEKGVISHDPEENAYKIGVWES